MKHPENLVTVAENMEKVKYGGYRDVITGDVKTVGTITERNHCLYSKMKSLNTAVKNVYEAGQAEADALKRSASGTSIVVDDVNDITHAVGCNVKSKNLLPTENISGSNYFNVTVENGVATQLSAGTSVNIISKILGYMDGTYVKVLDAQKLITAIGVYTYKIIIDGTYNNIRFGLNDSKIDSLCRIDVSHIPNGTYCFSANFTNITQGTVSWRDIQLEAGDTATSYQPYVGNYLSTVEVGRYGKNLYDFSLCDISDVAENNGTILEFIDGGAIVQGASGSSPGQSYYSNGWFVPGASAYKNNNRGVNLRAGDVVTISVDYTILENMYPEVNSKFGIFLGGADALQTKAVDYQVIGVTKRVFVTYIISKTGLYYPSFTLNSRKVRIENIQMELGSTNAGYEPYQNPQTVTANSDGTVEGITSLSPSMTLVTNNPGVIINAEYYAQK